MKKLLSIMLVLLMALSVFACTTPAQPDEPAEPEKPVEQPTEAPAEPTEPAEPTVEYEGLALNIKNKTGKTIDYLYIWPADEDAELMGASVVPMNWQDKDADGENYEKNIYIVRKAGVPMQIYLEFDDHTYLHFTGEQVGTLAMYDKLSFKGPTAEDLKHEANDDPADIEAMNLVAAIGKTADNFYPGYDLIPVELKNKTGKNIVEYYFYEEGAAPETYANVIGVAADLEGNIVNPWVNGRPYLFTYFVRPHTDANYYVYVVFEDGTNLTYPIENWFKPDGDGNLPNEISLKSAEDKYETKVQFDGDVEKDVDVAVPELLVMTIEKRLSADGWYPTYATVEADAAAVEAAKAALAAVPMIETEEQPAEPAEPAEPGEEPEATIPEGYEIPEGYVALVLNVKNKTGKTISGLYIYETPENPELFADLYVPIFDEPWLDKDADEANYERNIYIIRKASESYTIQAEFEDGTNFTADLGALNKYDKISLKGPTADDIKHEANDDPEDIAAMDALVAAGVASDGCYPGPAPMEAPEGYTGLHLMLKNKSGKEIEKVYLFPNGEDKGKNIFKTVVEGMIPTEDESVEGKPHEVFAYVYRETSKLGAMTLRVKYADGTEQDFVLEKPVEDYTCFTIKADEFKQKVTDDIEDIVAMDMVWFHSNGESTDGVTFEPIG